MSLEIKIKELNDVVVVGLVGNLDTNTAPQAESNINEWLEKGTKKMVINLEEQWRSKTLLSQRSCSGNFGYIGI
jgi:anti-anti-sigma factor